MKEIEDPLEVAWDGRLIEISQNVQRIKRFKIDVDRFRLVGYAYRGPGSIGLVVFASGREVPTHHLETPRNWVVV